MTAFPTSGLGLVDNVEPLEDQLERAVGERVVVARILPRSLIGTEWTLHSGNVWKTPWLMVVDGTPCDLVEVVAVPAVALSRQRSVADTAAGGWYYDVGSVTPAALSAWDSDVFTGWDGYPWLYVNLGGLDPNNRNAVQVIATPELLFSTRAMTQPTLGDVDDLGGKGDFEGEPAETLWLPTLTGNGAAEFVAGGYRDGGKMLRMSMTNDTALHPVEVDYDPGLVAIYGPEAALAVFGYYQTGEGQSDDVRPFVNVGDGVDIVTANGRDLGGAPTADQVVLAPTGGEWRHFAFVSRIFAKGGSELLKLGLANIATGAPRTGWAAFDKVQVRAVRRWSRYHPRLKGSVTLSQGSPRLLYGGKTVGVQGLRLVNTDGALERAWRSCARFAGARVELYLAGRYGGGAAGTASPLYGKPGVLLPRSSPGSPLTDARSKAAGLVQDCERSDADVSLSVEEIRTVIFNRKAAPTLYTSDFSENMDPRIAGRARQLVVGQAEEVEPARVDVTTSPAGCGVYEVADCSSWPTGIKDVLEVWLYPTTDAADRRDATYRLDLLALEGVLSKDLPNGRFSCLQPIVPLVLDTEHEYFTFKRNGVTYNARLLAGNESVELLPADANGTDGDCVVAGAPTLWEAVQAVGGGHARTASSVAANSYMSVSATACPTVTSVMHVELRAWVKATSWEENCRNYARLYVRIGGTRYFAPDPSTGHLLNPYTEWAELFYRWEFDPSAAPGTPWTKAQIDAAEWGVHFRVFPAFPKYLEVDFIRPEARVFLASTLSASNPGLCIPLTLAQRLQAEFRRQTGAANVTVTFDTATNKLTFASPAAASFELLCSTGKQKSGWGWIGADTSADKTGALTYTLDLPIYTQQSDVDKAILRCTVQGYRDGDPPVYAAQVNGLIENPADVLRFLLVEWFGLTEDAVDAASFAAARGEQTRAPVAMVLTDERTVADLVDALELAGTFDVIFAAGQDYGDQVRATAVPLKLALDGTEPRILEADVQSLKVLTRRSDVASQVEVKWGRTLRFGGSRKATNALATTLQRSAETPVFESDLRLDVDAQARADQLADWHADPEVIRVGVRGKLLLARPGDVFLLTWPRLRYAATPFRIMALDDDLFPGLSTVTAVRRKDLEA